jgi:uncharacterized protein (TIRG00374 family)
MTFKWITAKNPKLLLCLIVSSACLYLAVRGMNFDQAMEELKTTSLLPVLGAVFFLFLSHWIRAWRWGYLLLPIKPIAVLPLFRSTMIGFMGNFLFPFRAGELMRAVSIAHTEKVGAASALGSIVLERVFDGVVLSLTPFVLLAVLDLPAWVLRLNLAFLAVYMAGLLMAVVATKRGWALAWLKSVSRFLPESIDRSISFIAADFLQGMKSINQAGALMKVCYLSLLCWLACGMYFYFLFDALDLNLSLSAALVLQVVIAIGIIIPAAPGYAGSFEYFTILGLALFGVPQEKAFAYALLAHIFQFIPVTAVGLFFAFKKGFNFKEIQQPALT